MSIQNAPMGKKSVFQRIMDYWNRGTRQKIVILVIFLILFICCCSIAVSGMKPNTPNAPAQDPNAALTQAVDTAWAAITQTASAFTPTPSATPRPTDTPIPTATNTPLPQPITLTGTGDSVVDVNWDGPGIMHIKHVGGSNFAVQNFDANNQQIALSVNTIGNYEGTVPLDFLDSEDTARLQITAGGAWEITISPPAAARAFDLPATITGIGDDVVRLRGGNADLIKADNSQGTSNFAVWAYSQGGRDLVFNEIAPYTGTGLLQPSTFLLVITAEGNWSLEVTTK